MVDWISNGRRHMAMNAPPVIRPIWPKCSSTARAVSKKRTLAGGGGWGRNESRGSIEARDPREDGGSLGMGHRREAADEPLELGRAGGESGRRGHVGEVEDAAVLLHHPHVELHG